MSVELSTTPPRLSVRLKRIVVDPRTWARLAIVAVLAVAAFVVAVKVRRAGDLAPGLVLALPQLIELVFLGSGAWLLGQGWPRREGTSEHCAACGFERVHAEHRLLPTCPECGKPWAYFGGIARGRPVKSGPFIVAGAVGMSLGVGLVGVRTLLPSMFLRPVPTTMLIQQATQLPGYDPQSEDAWTELGVRKLTPSEEREIAMSLLDRRMRQRWLPDKASDWLGAAVKRGVGGEEIARRYREEMVALALDLPEIAEPDALIDYGVSAIVRGTPVGGAISFYIEAAWVENNDPAAQSAAPEPLLGALDTRLALPTSGTQKIYNGYITPQSVGERIIVVKGWLVMHGTFSPRPLMWTSDAKPILGVDTQWAQPIVLKRTVKIEAKPTGG